MIRKTITIIILSAALGAFLYFKPFFFQKPTPPRLIDRLPNADFVGKVNVLDLARETSGMMYYHKIPFRDFTSYEFLLGQGKMYGLNLQKKVYLFGNEFHLDGVLRADLRAEAIRQFDVGLLTAQRVIATMPGIKGDQVVSIVDLLLTDRRRARFVALLEQAARLGGTLQAGVHIHSAIDTLPRSLPLQRERDGPTVGRADGLIDFGSGRSRGGGRRRDGGRGSGTRERVRATGFRRRPIQGLALGVIAIDLRTLDTTLGGDDHAGLHASGRTLRPHGRKDGQGQQHGNGDAGSQGHLSWATPRPTSIPS